MTLPRAPPARVCSRQRAGRCSCVPPVMICGQMITRGDMGRRVSSVLGVVFLPRGSLGGGFADASSFDNTKSRDGEAFERGLAGLPCRGLGLHKECPRLVFFQPRALGALTASAGVTIVTESEDSLINCETNFESTIWRPLLV